MKSTANLVLDVESYELTHQEQEIINHPYVGGVILFSRNYHDPSQLIELNRQIRQASRGDILISVDHEGGRVQRFRDGFSPIPAMSAFENLQVDDTERLNIITEMGWLMAVEVMASDIDLSFAPVLDLNRVSEVIGCRSFSSDPQQVVKFANAFIDGMQQAGMKACGKHFPGHGSVVADSHIAMPTDERDQSEIVETDMSVFSQLIEQNKLDALMPAHVIYPNVDNMPAGFSRVWLQQILKQQLGFNGLIFSDDLSMKAADAVQGYVAKAEVALDAGCNMLLACNNPAGAIQILDDYRHLETIAPAFEQNLLKQKRYSFADLARLPRWQQAQQWAQRIAEG